MSTAQATAPPPDLAADKASSERILSLDVTRGLIILLMIFVNDVSSTHNVFPFLKHFYGNGMMLPDIVFGAFLFIVGMSMPLAFSKRLNNGSILQLLTHILSRSFSLILLGVLTVAGPATVKFHFITVENETLLKILPYLWSFVTYTCVLLAWHHVNTSTKRGKVISLTIRIVAGITILYLMTIYRRDDLPIQPRWWGILGLIGWAYLLCALIYLIVRNNPYFLATAVIALYAVYVLFRTGDNFLFSGAPGTPLSWTPHWNGEPLWLSFRFTGETIGSQAAITMTGILFGTAFLKNSKYSDPVKRITHALVFALVLALLGLACQPIYGINKPTATLSWCLYCSAITIVIWLFMYLLIDIYKYQKWTFLVGPAGSNPLFAYMLAPILYKLFGICDKLTSPNAYSPFSLGREIAHWFGNDVLLGNPDNLIFTQPYIGITKSIVYALFVVALTGVIAKRGFRIKL
ncbi:DUF5009 domain-containing protein [Planctomycetota bacterium]|nr:DUF5009 domain-containing protein [Planctomycetota bacterium]